MKENKKAFRRNDSTDKRFKSQENTRCRAILSIFQNKNKTRMEKTVIES